MRNIVNLIDEVRDLVDEHVQAMRREPASRLGLDDRCGSVWIDEDAIVAYKGSRIDYYGGFEYVKGEDRVELGEYVFYLSTSSRVSDCIETLMEYDGECSSEDDGQPTEHEEWMSFDPDC